MASPLFLGVNGTSHALGMSREQMADNIRVVESRRINCCYVGRFRPHVVASELPRLACIFFTLAASHGRLSTSPSLSSLTTLSLSSSTALTVPSLWLPPVSGSASTFISGLSSCVSSETYHFKSGKVSSSPSL